MKKTKKWLAVIAMALAVCMAIGLTACGKKKTEDSKGPQFAEEIEAGSAFDGILIQQFARAPGWDTPNQPSGIVDLAIGVDVTDWTGVEKFRIRVRNVCTVDVNEFAVNIGSDVTGAQGETAWARASRKAEGGIKTYKLDGVTENSPLTYPRDCPASSDGNDGSRYCSLDASFNGYIEYDFAKAFTDDYYTLGAEANDGIMAWSDTSKIGYNPQDEVDTLKRVELDKMKLIYFTFEPISYDNVNLIFSDFQIQKTGSSEWISVVDMSEAEVITKANDATWRAAVHGIGANKVLLDPWYPTAGATTAHFKAEKVNGVACNLHYEGNEDGLCDRCGTLIPHEVNDLAETGTCMTCNHTYCQTHKDDNKDGVCDTCGHLAK